MSAIPTGYKQTEVGVIPEDWSPHTIGDLIDFEGGSQPDKSVFRPSWKAGYVRLIQIRDYKTDKYETYIPLNLARRFCNELDIMIGRYGPPVFQILRGIDGAYNVALIKAKPCAAINNSYAYYFLKQEKLFAFIEKLSQRSSGQTGVDLKELRQYPLPLPTKDEQEAIAKALSDADALIESLEQLVAKKRHLKQGTMQELLTGKKRLPGFSGEWKTKQVGDFTDCTAGGTPSTSVQEYWGGSIRWMSSGELNKKIVDEVEGRITEEGLKNSSTKLIPAGSVLIGLAGQGKTRGTAAMNTIPLCTNQSIAAIFPNQSFDAQYLYYNLDRRYEELRELSAGDGGRGGLNLTIIRSLIVPFPERDEQEAIAHVLSDMDAEIAELETQLTKTRALKQGMMHKLLTGEIRLI